MVSNKNQTPENLTNKKVVSKKEPSIVRSSAAEYLTFVAASGGGVEAIYSEEDVWLTQKMMGVLHDASPNSRKNS